MTAARLGASFDLLAAWQRGRRLPGPRRGRDRHGPGRAGCAERGGRCARASGPTGTVAAGALPFAGDGRRCVIGDAQVRRTDPFVTTKIGEGDADAGDGRRAGRGVPRCRRDAGARARALRRRAWPRRCGASTTGELRKVVLARTIEVAGRPNGSTRGDSPIGCAPSIPMRSRSSRRPTAGCWSARHRSCSSRGRGARCARTRWPVPRRGRATGSRISANADALAASAKNREEHAIVVDAVAEALRPLCATLTWDPEPVLLETANVWHLSTRFRGRLADPAPSALDLALALHPTPAVAGAPTEVARAAIGQLEGFDRGRYAGPVGWVDADGQRRVGDRAAVRAAFAGPRDAVRGGRDRRWQRPRRGARRDRPEVPRVPRRAAVGLSDAAPARRRSTRKGGSTVRGSQTSRSRSGTRRGRSTSRSHARSVDRDLLDRGRHRGRRGGRAPSSSWRRATC